MSDMTRKRKKKKKERLPWSLKTGTGEDPIEGKGYV